MRRKGRKRRKEEKEDIFDFNIPKGISLDFGLSTQKKKRNKEANDLDLDISQIIPSSIDLGFSGQKRININKIPKVELVGILSKKLSENQIYQALIRLGKYKLAENFTSEIEFVNRRYDKILMELDGKAEENAEDKILKVIVEEIMNHMKRLYSMSFKPKNEIEFHKQIEPFLKGLISVIEDSLIKFGWKFKVYREYKLPSNERIDLMISIGNMKIGIEVKYDLKETSKLQRLLGQIDRYIPYTNMLIIISYNPINARAIKSIKNKETEKGRTIRIVTPNEVI